MTASDRILGLARPLRRSPTRTPRRPADRLGLAVGARMPLESRIRPGVQVMVTIAGIFRIDDPADPFWWADRQVLDALTRRSSTSRIA